MRYPTARRQTSITAPGKSCCDPARRPDRPSLDQEPDGQPGRHASSMPASARTATSPRTASRPKAGPRSGRSTGDRRCTASSPRPAQSQRPAVRAADPCLWAVVNERDELGPDLVPDYLTSVKDGAFYGWPYSYYGQHVDPRVHAAAARSGRQGDPAGLRAELACRAARAGVLHGHSLPEHYRGGAFVGEHGSWDRTVLNGYKVVYRAVQRRQAERHGRGCRHRLSRPTETRRAAARWAGGRQDGAPADRRRCRQHRVAGRVHIRYHYTIPGVVRRPHRLDGDQERRDLRHRAVVSAHGGV
jgi:hypothetical protein